MNGITRETFEGMPVEDKLNVLYDLIQGSSRWEKILSSICGGISGALVMAGYLILK
jgi:hypothetical protein